MSLSSWNDVWNSLTISNDGQPLAVEVADFLPWNFPYHRLPSQDNAVTCLLRPEVMVLMVFLYMASKPLLVNVVESRRGVYKSNKNILSLQQFVAWHNLALSVFSLVVAVATWSLLWKQASQTSIRETYCDRSFLYETSSFGTWALIFYMSKYYEFVDTWILILKGKQPSFLQLYHHVGIAASMWGGLVSHASWLTIVVCLNSVIHTCMYFYFFCKTVHPNLVLNKLARCLTYCQIGQFVLGILIQARLEPCERSSPASQFMCTLIVVYALGLIGLFVAFAMKKYYKKQQKRQPKAQ